MALAEKLDNELVFLVVVTLGVIAIMSILTWAGKATGMTGVSTAAQHP
jgi:hypothetical protein